MKGGQRYLGPETAHLRTSEAIVWTQRCVSRKRLALTFSKDSPVMCCTVARLQRAGKDSQLTYEWADERTLTRREAVVVASSPLRGEEQWGLLISV